MPRDRGVPVVDLTDVSKVYVSGQTEVHALRHVDLTIERGESLAIVGPSGSGKSTLLNVVGCLDVATTGTYLLNGVDVAKLSDAGRTAVRGSEIGFVFQSFHLLSHRSVRENVELCDVYRTTLSGRADRRGRREQAEEALERVGLQHRMEFRPTELSGGERQRVAIARAIASRPSLLLCDEPTGNLDTATTATVLDVFAGLHEAGLTIVVITHEPEVASHFQRSVTIRDGLLTATPVPA